MCKWYNEMECYIVAPEQTSYKHPLDKIAHKAQLEQSFRNYAALFDKVKIVIKQSQTKEYYLNFPHFSYTDKSFSISNLLKKSNSDAIFLGHTNMGEFPISILAKLLKSYNGELFMGYKSNKHQFQQIQIGIYSKALLSNSKFNSDFRLDSLSKNSYRLFALPEYSL